MKFKVLGQDWGLHVVRFDDGTVRKLDDAELAVLESSEDATELRVAFVPKATLANLARVGVRSLDDIRASSDAALMAIDGVGETVLGHLRRAAGEVWPRPVEPVEPVEPGGEGG